MRDVPGRAAHDTEGFALVDALIASAILATAVLALAQLLAFAATATGVAGRTTRAALLAAQKLEELHASSLDPVGMNAADAPEPGFAREWSVAALPAAPADLALIEVIVRTAGTETRMVALQPRIAR